MTKDEAIIVLEIMSFADGGCPVCSSNLYVNFGLEFPEFRPLVDQTILKELSEDYSVDWAEEEKYYLADKESEETST